MDGEYNPLNDSFLKENEYIFKKYKPIKRIGKGSFGNIYSTVRIGDKSVFAMKTEKINNLKTLESEAYYLYLLQGFGIPKLITYGHTKKYNILIETLLDKSLHNIFCKTKKMCNIEDACLIAIQLLDRLEWIHSKYIVYRDVKPENFLIGIKDPNIIYVVDFGLCKKYRSSKTGKHILPRLTGRFNGTLLYASPNAVRGKEASRRDDIISLGYMLVYLIKRSLPWRKEFKGLTKKKYAETLHNKDSDGNGELFKKIPQELIEYIKYAKNIKFEEEPNYQYLRSLFYNLLEKKNLNYRTLIFSWIGSDKKNKLSCIPKSNSKRKKSPFVKILKNIQEGKVKCQTIKNLKLNDNTSFLDKRINTPCEHSNNDIAIERIKLNSKMIITKPLNLKAKSNVKSNKARKNNTMNKIPFNYNTEKRKNNMSLSRNINYNNNINFNINDITNNKDDNIINMDYNSYRNKDNNSNNNANYQNGATPILIKNISINYINANSYSNISNNKIQKKMIPDNCSHLLYKRKMPISFKKKKILNNLTNNISYNTSFKNYNKLNRLTKGNNTPTQIKNYNNKYNSIKSEQKTNTYLIDYEDPLRFINNGNI